VPPSSALATSELASSLRHLREKWDSTGGGSSEGGDATTSPPSGGFESAEGSPSSGDKSGPEASHSKSFMSPLAKKTASKAEGGEASDANPATSLRAAAARLSLLETEVLASRDREAELREELVQARAEIRRLRTLVTEYEEGLNPGEDPQRRAGANGEYADGEDENKEPDFDEVCAFVGTWV
jgi:hypothetical protein